MKLIAIFFLLGLSFGCGNSPVPVQQNSNGGRVERSQPVIGHSAENQTPPPAATGEKTKWSQSGDPIDTTEFDAAIKTAEKTLSGKPNDAAAKKSLSQAYYKRAVALTDARQYASAIGDYRRVLKYEPGNSEAKDWIDKIIMIYGSLNKSYPQEGEEPPPLPFEGGKVKK